MTTERPQGFSGYHCQQDWTEDPVFLDVVEALALPIATLTFAVLAHMTRMTRAAVLIGEVGDVFDRGT